MSNYDPSFELAGSGALEGRVRSDVQAMVSAHPMLESLAQGAYVLAKRVDDGIEDKSLAPTMRELRSYLNDLARLGVPDDDGFESEIGTPSVSAPVRDPEKP